MRIRLWIALLALTGALSAAPATTNNDDSCDISLLPAATLLLPYFEVDLNSPNGENTLFTITNVTQLPQAARVTVWTDRSYPVFNFNIFLTGYDVQSISLYDLLGEGVIAPPDGTTSDTDAGERSLASNPNLDVSNCDILAVHIPPATLERLRQSFTTGVVPGCQNRVGGLQPDGHARGYITVDVVRACVPYLPTEPGFASTLSFDNVLSGDYQQLNRTWNFAQGGTMVHIRAIPEGGTAGEKTTDFQRTFYSRFQSGGTADRRQPLPSTFAGRWIGGGPTEFTTHYKIWRDGVTGADAGCNVLPNAENAVTEFVRFDDEENPTVLLRCCCILCPEEITVVPSASRADAADTNLFPPVENGAVSGWMYLNLDNKKPIDGTAATQGWVVVSMAAEGRFSVDFDALALGNGCSPPAPITSEDESAPAIGPAPNGNEGQ